MSQLNISDVRPEVVRFAILMETVLRENDHKGGFAGLAPDYLLRGIVRETGELAEALDAIQELMDQASDTHQWVEDLSAKLREAQRECADVANFSMGLSGVIDALLDIRT